MTEVEVWVQADILIVRTTLVPAGRASALETMLLKAVRGGANHADDLCDVFGLAPRLVESILGDLWRVGRISIDLGTEREEIVLTSAAHKELDELAEGGSVRSTADRVSSEEVAHDRLTGRVLPWQATRRFPRQRGLVVPTMVDDPEISQLQESDLAAAVSRTLNWRGEEAPGSAAEKQDEPYRVGDMRIDTAYLAPALLQTSRRRRYIPLRVQVFEDAAGTLSVQVTDDRLTRWARVQAARRLNGLIADQPTARFVTQLRQHAQHGFPHERDLSQLVADLRAVAETLLSHSHANRQREHDRARGLAGDIEEYTKALVLTEMDAKVITTSEQHRDAINGMLRRARRQVVIAVPWVRQRGVLGIRDAMIAAVARGIQVTVLLGISSGTQALDENVLATLDEIEEHARTSGRGGELRYHRTRGARSHAKVVVADDRELLVTSKNFLSGSHLTEVGLLLSAPASGPAAAPLACPVIGEVLKFLYDHTPDPATAFTLIRDTKGFGPRRDEPDLPPVPLPHLTAAVLDPNAPPEHARAWAAAWQEAARALAERAARSRPTVEVIKDGQHVALVREALEEARHRVLITSHRVSEQALTAEVCSVAVARAAQGLDVAMRYGEVRDDEAADRLRRLADSADPKAADVRGQEGMHAKVVVRDDSTVLGSFNHLSVDAGVRGLRATGELSLRIASAAVADDVWAALLGRPSWAPSDPVADSGAVPQGSAVSAQFLLELLQPADGLPDARALTALVQAEGTDQVLATLRRLELNPGARRRVLAAAALPVLAAPGPDRDSRLAALMPAVWEMGAWTCADLVRRNIPDRDLSPRPVLTAALADRAGHASAVWAAVAGEIEITAAEAEALAVCGCVCMLLGEIDAPDMVDLLRNWERPAASRSDEFVAAALDYWAHYGPLPADLPDITRRSGSVTTEPDRQREALRAALDSLRRYDTHSESGDAVRDRLFGPEGEMAKLAAVLDAGDTAGLRAWDETYTEVNDSRWLIKVTKLANQPAIDDHRKVSFIEKHRAIRLALRDLRAALDEEGAVGPVELPAAQTTLLHRMRELTAEMAPGRPVPASSPEDAALILHVTRLQARLAGKAAAARPGPAASLDSWALPMTAVARAAAQPADPAPEVLLAAVVQDLAAGWTGEQAVKLLLSQGEFGLADTCIALLRDDDLIDDAQESTLRGAMAAARAAAEDLLDARARAVRLRCDRIGLDGDDPRWRDLGELGSRLEVSLARFTEAEKRLDEAIEQRRQQLADDLAACRAELSPDWAEHIDGLIEADELAVAQLALTPALRNGRGLLPQPVRVSPWSWRSADLAEVAAWFEPDRAGVPQHVRAEFLPDPADEAAIQVVNALHAVAEGAPQAAAEWLAAVQSLVAETDAPPTVREAGNGGFTGDFVLPYDMRLPRLSWVGRPPEKVSVGDTSQREPLHFSLDLMDRRASTAVITVSDVLSLLSRDPARRPASTASRALRFLGMVCTQLPLDRIIAPHDTPAEYAPERRMALAWLLSILGFFFTPADLDVLRMLGGGHQIPLWRLIDAARDDPMKGIGDLRDRRDLDQILVEALTADLDSDTDLLVLCTLVMMDVTDRASAAEALALIWEDTGKTAPAPDKVGLDAALDRLIGKGYLIAEADGRFRNCGCAVVRAQRRTDLAGQIRRLVERVNTTLEVGDLMYRELLSWARHADQAEAAVRSPEEQRASARRNSEARMSDPTPFDLSRLCSEQARRGDMMRDDVDVLWDIPDDEPLWAAGPDVPYEYLVRELLANAISAVADKDQTGVVWLTLRAAADADAADAELTVSDNGPGFPADFRAAFEARTAMYRPDRPDDENVFHTLRMFAEARGARFQLGDRPGGGAVITVYLPISSHGS